MSQTSWGLLETSTANSMLPQACQKALLQRVGFAYDPKSGKLLYSECHFLVSPKASDKPSQSPGVQKTVEYFDSQGRRFASKKLYGSLSTQLADGQANFCINMSFVDVYAGQKYAVRCLANKPALKVYYEQNSPLDFAVLQRDVVQHALEFDKTLDNVVERYAERVNFADSLPVVVDAGFDRAVLYWWDDLIKGAEQRFVFLAITRGRLVKFRLQLFEQAAQSIKLKLSADQWWVRLLMSPIYLTYDRNKRLQQFEGLTNISRQSTHVGQLKVDNGKEGESGLSLSDSKEGNVVARIEYVYPR